MQKEIPINQQISFEEYKERVRKRLLEFNSPERVERLMKIHDDTLVNYYNDNWEVNAIAGAMSINYA